MNKNCCNPINLPDAGSQSSAPFGESKFLPFCCRLVAWEITRTCNLACAHCRGSAKGSSYSGELDTAAAKDLICQFKEVGRPLLIFTGGEPLLRADIFDLLHFAKKQGLPCAVSTNGTLLDTQNAKELAVAGVRRCSVSLDEPEAAAHDLFRGAAGSFAAALRGIECLKKAALPFQINTTVTTRNMNKLPQMLSLCQELGAVAWHVFVLLPVGRAVNAEALESLGTENYAQVLRWLRVQEKQGYLEIKPTCAPQYYCLEPFEAADNLQGESEPGKNGSGENGSGENGSGENGSGENGSGESDLARSDLSRNDLNGNNAGYASGYELACEVPLQKEGHKKNVITGVARQNRRGCLGGINFCFVSHSGQVQPCGYLELDCGNVQKLPFGQIWQHSPELQLLRQPDLYTGKCGQCRYRALCGGCRVRALSAGGDFLGPDPLCFIDFA